MESVCVVHNIFVIPTHYISYHCSIFCYSYIKTASILFRTL